MLAEFSDKFNYRKLTIIGLVACTFGLLLQYVIFPPALKTILKHVKSVAKLYIIFICQSAGINLSLIAEITIETGLTNAIDVRRIAFPIDS